MIHRLKNLFFITEQDIETFQRVIKIIHIRILEESKINCPIIHPKEEEGNCLLITIAQLTCVIINKSPKQTSTFNDKVQTNHEEVNDKEMNKK
jgi:hypothetical protein